MAPPKSAEWVNEDSVISIHHDKFIQYHKVSRYGFTSSNAIHTQGSILAHSLIQDGQLLVSTRNIPIKLIDINDGSTISSYSFSNQRHETLLDTYSLSRCNDNVSSFIAGSINRVAIMDLNTSTPAFMSNRDPRLGTISSIIPAREEYHASFFTGSYITNSICMIDPLSGYGDDFVVANTHIPIGNAITQLLISTNSRFLYAVGRHSNSIKVLDLRMGLRQVASLSGWDIPDTDQKFFCDLLPQSKGLIAGTQTGDIQVWPDAELGIDSVAQEHIISTGTNKIVSSVQYNKFATRDVDQVVYTFNTDDADELGISITSL